MLCPRWCEDNLAIVISLSLGIGIVIGTMVLLWIAGGD